MASKHLSSIGKEYLALNNDLDVKILKQKLKELIKIITKLENLQHHRKFCVDSISNLSANEQTALFKNGFDFLTLFNYVEDSNLIYKEIELNHKEITKIHRRIVRSQKLLKTKLQDNLKDAYK